MKLLEVHKQLKLAWHFYHDSFTDFLSRSGGHTEEVAEMGVFDSLTKSMCYLHMLLQG